MAPIEQLVVAHVDEVGVRDLNGARTSRASLVERGSCEIQPRAVLRRGNPPKMMRLLETTKRSFETADDSSETGS